MIALRNLVMRDEESARNSIGYALSQHLKTSSIIIVVVVVAGVLIACKDTRSNKIIDRLGAGQRSPFGCQRQSAGPLGRLPIKGAVFVLCTQVCVFVCLGPLC